MADINLIVGRLEGRMDAVESEISGIRSELHAMRQTLEQVNTTLTTAKGGWRMLVVVGSAIAGIAGVVWVVFGIMRH